MVFLSLIDMPKYRVHKYILSIIVLLDSFTMRLVLDASLLVVYMINDLRVVRYWVDSLTWWVGPGIDSCHHPFQDENLVKVGQWVCQWC